MPIQNPTQLADEFKKSGEFDRLRRDVLAQFRDGDGFASFMKRVEDITKQKLSSDQKLQYMSETAISRELMQELDRYPIVERAIADFRSLSDPSVASAIRESVSKILQDDRKSANGADAFARPSNAATSERKAEPMKVDIRRAPDVSVSTSQAVQAVPQAPPGASGRSAAQENANSRIVPSINTTLDGKHADRAESPDSTMLESPLTEHESEANGS